MTGLHTLPSSRPLSGLILEDVILEYEWEDLARHSGRPKEQQPFASAAQVGTVTLLGPLPFEPDHSSAPMTAALIPPGERTDSCCSCPSDRNLDVSVPAGSALLPLLQLHLDPHTIKRPEFFPASGGSLISGVVLQASEARAARLEERQQGLTVVAPAVDGQVLN